MLETFQHTNLRFLGLISIWMLFPFFRVRFMWKPQQLWGRERKKKCFLPGNDTWPLYAPAASFRQPANSNRWTTIREFFFLFFTIPTHLISPARLCWSALLARYQPVTLMVPVQLGWTPTWAATKIVSLRTVLVPIISDPKSNKRYVSYSWKIKKIKKKEPQCHFKSLQV